MPRVEQIERDEYVPAHADGTGISAAVATSFAKRDFSVALLSRTQAKLDLAAKGRVCGVLLNVVDACVQWHTTATANKHAAISLFVICHKCRRTSEVGKVRPAIIISLHLTDLAKDHGVQAKGYAVDLLDGAAVKAVISKVRAQVHSQQGAV